MKFSDAGLALLKRSEGFRSKVYKDVCGFPTIGYGHRLLHPDSFPNGINEADASDILVSDVNAACQTVERLVKVPLTQGQFDALVDFTFNLGGVRLAGSTLLRDLNAGKYDDARGQLLLWDHGLENGHEVELAALKKRREAEVALWRQGSEVRDQGSVGTEAV
jgi:lysozyme